MDEIISYNMCPVKVRNAKLRNYLKTALNGIDFKFVSHGLWSEKQNILRQHMH